ncbi:S-adenosylmethionine--2-demethylmenaquinone methyltransferase [Lonsdalea iberica]|uniref:Putative 4-hydroxy-4-methyl-2-oxoglutarate aldolase n=1 Tax=Lonsdalea iberica TaxID=1082703 RepID=A0ABX3XDA0_9GAMM|nr:RraA family protein [Lonsdalea iberica]OSN06933.1 S-adenosylmethionine--2-demethylmenaquinone methyltransferase [Lonsdalea iberica]
MTYDLLPRQQNASDDLLAQWRRIETSTLGHLTDEGYLRGIRALSPGVSVAGNVVTVSLRMPDGGALREALLLSQPGDVLVIDAMEDAERACWGELRTLAAQIKGVAGVIVSGAVTDARALRVLGWPVFCRGVSAITTRAQGRGGEVNHPIVVSGVTVRPGDIALADDDGVFILSAERAAHWFLRVSEKSRADAERRKDLIRRRG